MSPLLTLSLEYGIILGKSWSIHVAYGNSTTVTTRGGASLDIMRQNLKKTFFL